MSESIEFPKLEYKQIHSTLGTIHNYAKFLGAIRSSMTPKQKDYWHISLSTAPAGFRTTPIPTPEGNTFEILLNLVSDYLSITTSKGYCWSMMLSGQSLDIFSRDVISELNNLGINPDIDLEKFQDQSYLDYDPETASEIFRAYSVIDMVFKEFKGSLTLETSPVQLWPHHMDIAFTCYPGVANEKIKQIGSGYLLGDSSIEEPYFYITAYPELEEYSDIELIDRAYWNIEGWQGVVLKYADLKSINDPKKVLLDHLSTTFNQILDKKT